MSERRSSMWKFWELLRLKYELRFRSPSPTVQPAVVPGYEKKTEAMLPNLATYTAPGAVPRPASLRRQSPQLLSRRLCLRAP